MKSRLLIFAVLLLFSLYSIGQPLLGFSKALIIKKNGDSLKCLVELLGGLEDFVYYKTGTYDKELSLKISEISIIITDSRIYENVRLEKMEKILELVIDGPIKLYKGTHAAVGKLSTRSIKHLDKPSIEYVIKNGEDYIEIKEKTFKDTLLKILKDCERVLQRLDTNFYKFESLEYAFEDYYNCNGPDLQEEKFDPRLLGSWSADRKDKMTKDNIGKASLRFEKGTIIYMNLEESNLNAINYGYKIRGDSIISYDANTRSVQVTKYKFDGNDKLILEINGIRSVFIRNKN